MNPVDHAMQMELMALLDRLASSLPQGMLVSAGTSPTRRKRLDEAEARLADCRAAVLADYGRWRAGLEDLENLWALANWRLTAQEPPEQATTLAA